MKAFLQFGRKGLYHLAIAFTAALPVLIWIWKDSLIPSSWDAADIVTDGIQHYMSWTQGLTTYIQDTFYHGRHWRAGLLPITLSWAMIFYDGDLFSALKFLHLFWALAFAISIHLFAGLFFNRWISFVICIFVVNLPMSFSHMTQFMNETPMVTLCAMAIYFWTKDSLDQWRNDNAARLFILFSFFAAIFRVAEAIAILGPFLGWMLYQKNSTSRRQGLIAILAPTLALALVAANFAWLSSLGWRPTSEIATSILIGSIIALPAIFWTQRKFVLVAESILLILGLFLFYSFGAKNLVLWLWDSSFGPSAFSTGIRKDFISSIQFLIRGSGLYLAFGSILSMLALVGIKLKSKQLQTTLLLLLTGLLLFPIMFLISKNSDNRYYLPCFTLLLIVITAILFEVEKTTSSKIRCLLWVVPLAMTTLAMTVQQFNSVLNTRYFGVSAEKYFGSVGSHLSWNATPRLSVLLDDLNHLTPNQTILLVAQTFHSELKNEMINYSSFFHKGHVKVLYPSNAFTPTPIEIDSVLLSEHNPGLPDVLSWMPEDKKWLDQEFPDCIVHPCRHHLYRYHRKLVFPGHFEQIPLHLYSKKPLAKP